MSGTFFSNVNNIQRMILKMLCLYTLGQNCLLVKFKPYLSSETYSRKYEKLPDTLIHACKNITENVFVENVWPANSALFIYVLTHSSTTLDIFSWPGGAVVTHPLWVQEVPGSIPVSRKSFYVRLFCCVIVVFLLFVQTHIISHKSLQC